MKKLLTILGAVGLTATGATSAVVSCGTKNKVTDLSKFDGKVAGAAKSGSQNSNLRATYETVGGLKKGIAAAMGVDATQLDGGIMIKTSPTYVGSKTLATDDDDVLLNDNFYFATMKPIADSKTVIGEITDKAIIADSAKKIDLGTIPRNDFKFNIAFADSYANQKNMKNAALANLATITGVKSSLVTTSLFNLEEDKIIYSTKTANAMKIGTAATKADKDLVAKPDAALFTGKMSKEVITGQAAHVDLTTLSGSKTIALTPSSWDANGRLTEIGEDKANFAISTWVQELLSKKTLSADYFTVVTSSPSWNQASLNLNFGITSGASGTQIGGRVTCIEFQKGPDLNHGNELYGSLESSALKVKLTIS